VVWCIANLRESRSLTLAVACRRGDNDELQRYFERLLKAKLVPVSRFVCERFYPDSRRVER
jgi:hypothetical protein